MSINYQFGDVDAHGALIRAQAASLEQAHQAIVRDVLAAGDFWGGSGSVACQEFITQLGRNFQVIYEQANSHGQKVQTAGNNMNSTDSAVGGSWASPPPPLWARTPLGGRATTFGWSCRIIRPAAAEPCCYAYRFAAAHRPRVRPAAETSPWLQPAHWPPRPAPRQSHWRARALRRQG